jgi:ParB family chromosome partitioning protein
MANIEGNGRGEQGWTVTPVPIDSIVVDQQRLREIIDDDGIIELAESITRQGLLQPIGVAPREDGRFQLLWGLRRLTAHVRLRRATIDARVYMDAGVPVKALALVENLQRAAMSLREECDAVHYLHSEDNLSPDQIGALLSKGRTWVLTRLAVPGFPDDVRAAVLDEAISLGGAEALARLDDPGMRALILAQATNSRLSVAQIRALVQVALESPSIATAIDAGEQMAIQMSEPSRLLQRCDACGRPMPVGELKLIRVCADAEACTGAQATNAGDGD